jgi:hypothetical protein
MSIEQRLTEEEVLEIYDRYMNKGESGLSLACDYGRSESSIHKYLREQAIGEGYSPRLRINEMRKIHRGETPDLGRRARNERHRKKAILDKKYKVGIDCHLCGEPHAVHARCGRCGILLHPEDSAYICNCGVQHGVKGLDGLCLECEGVLGGDIRRVA